MAWDDERERRARSARERGGGGAGAPTEPIGAPRPGVRERVAGLRGPAQRVGWMVALGLAILAVVLSGVALARSGDDDGRGRDDRGVAMERGWDRGGDMGWHGGRGGR